MAALPVYETIDEKNAKFKISKFNPGNKIDTIQRFNSWYDDYLNVTGIEKSQFFFRGMGEAKYKLFTSAQRKWITAEVENWKGNANYEDFIISLVNRAKADTLFQRVFRFYKLSEGADDFPILSILQHYGGPTPLMDWTYDLDVALFFAIEFITSATASNDINNYFSVYCLDNRTITIKSIGKFKANVYPTLKQVFNQTKKTSDDREKLFFLSDYERDKKEPLTTIYNQNIIPQQGIFIFNPSPTKPFEDYFQDTDNDLHDAHFRCYNIRKALAEYIRRKIASKGIVKSLIYPNLRNNITAIHETVMNSYFQPQ